jgi:hypothetical protein
MHGQVRDAERDGAVWIAEGHSCELRTVDGDLFEQPQKKSPDAGHATGHELATVHGQGHGRDPR